MPLTCVAAFVKMSQESGHNVPMSRIPFSRYVYVAGTEEEARNDARDAINWTLDMIQWRRHFAEGSEVLHRLDDWRRDRTEQPESYEHIHENRAIIGTPDQCVAKIKELRDQGIEHFVGFFSFGGIEHRKVMRSMELFAGEVMPHFS